MNNESGSALQKANFVLLVIITAALAYLIVRERIQSAKEKPEVTLTAPEFIQPPATTWNPREMRTSFAPLRPRMETNFAGVPTNRIATSPANRSLIVDRPRPTPGERITLPLPDAPFPAEPAAVAGGGAGRGQAPSFTGRVVLRGTPPPEKQIALDAACARLNAGPMFTRHFVVGRDGGLSDVFVYVKIGAPPDLGAPTSSPVLDVSQCQFQPYILGLRTGEPFTLRNSGSVLENVHIIPKGGGRNREMNISLPVKNMTTRKIIPEPEIFIRVKCDLHPWMFAYLCAVEHRWFTVSDQNGHFALPPGLPPGPYTIAAVHPKAGEMVQEVTLTGDEPPVLRFVLEVPPALARNR